jgi:hypothetical protein
MINLDDALRVCLLLRAADAAGLLVEERSSATSTFNPPDASRAGGRWFEPSRANASRAKRPSPGRGEGGWVGGRVERSARTRPGGDL